MDDSLLFPIPDRKARGQLLVQVRPGCMVALESALLFVLARLQKFRSFPGPISHSEPGNTMKASRALNRSFCVAVTGLCCNDQRSSLKA